jgi:HK97 family phage major capsid protein
VTTDVIQREFENYRKADAEARSVLEQHGDGDLTPEEEEHFNKAVDAAEASLARSKKLTSMEQNRKEFESRMSDLNPVPDSTGGADAPSDFTSQLIDAIRTTKAEFDNGNSRYETAVYGKVDLSKRDEFRTITDFGNSGSLYTTDFATNVAIFQRTVSPWINLASILNADNGRPINLPSLSADPTAYAPGEGTAITAADPTLGSAALTTTAYKALGYVSQEAEEDELVGLLPIIAKVQGRSIGLKFGSDLTVAIVAAATNGGTASGVGGVGTATVTFIGLEDLLDLKFGLAAPYRQTGVWVMANALIKKIRKFHDGNGNYFYQSASNPQTAASFDGDAIYEDPYLAAPASVSKSVLYGDASAVVIKQMPLRVATSPDYQFNLDVIALKTVYRAGGALPDAAAIRYMISANT